MYGTSTWATHPEVVDVYDLEGLPMMAIACMSDSVACMVNSEFILSRILLGAIRHNFGRPLH